MTRKSTVLAFATIAVATSAMAQTTAAPPAPLAQAPTTAPPPLVQAPSVAPAPSCELHIRPAHNFIAMNTGMLSGLGIVGALVDMGVHADKVKSVKAQMADALTADAQIAQLKSVDAAGLLKMPKDTVIVVDEPFPSADEIKADPALKEKMKAFEADEKAGKRLTSSKAECYAELAAPYVFYQKAAMYGTRVFTDFFFRDFRGGVAQPKVSKGQVETHTPDFPAATPDKVDSAKLALLDSFGKDLVKWVSLKLKS